MKGCRENDLSKGDILKSDETQSTGKIKLKNTINTE